jgi:hypothetical protein
MLVQVSAIALIRAALTASRSLSVLSVAALIGAVYIGG